MKVTIYNLKIFFNQPPLGTQPNKPVATKYIMSKAADEAGELPPDELQTVPQQLEDMTTGFHRADGKIIFYDYQLRGFLKYAGKVNNGKDGCPKALKSKVNDLVFVRPRQIEVQYSQNSTISYLERPLRAETPQGPRTSVIRSEQLPEGAFIECELHVLGDEISEATLRKLLVYGEYQGLGQWRNAGHGAFRYELNRLTPEERRART